MCFRDARPVIMHCNDGTAAVAPGPDGHPAVVSQRFHTIAEQVQQDLAEMAAIEPDIRRTVDIGPERDGFFSQPLVRHRAHFFDQRGQIDLLRMRFQRPAVAEVCGDQRLQSGNFLEHLVGVAGVGGLALEIFPHQPGEQLDASQGIADLVRNLGQHGFLLLMMLGEIPAHLIQGGGQDRQFAAHRPGQRGVEFSAADQLAETHQAVNRPGQCPGQQPAGEDGQQHPGSANPPEHPGKPFHFFQAGGVLLHPQPMIAIQAVESPQIPLPIIPFEGQRSGRLPALQGLDLSAAEQQPGVAAPGFPGGGLHQDTKFMIKNKDIRQPHVLRLRPHIIAVITTRQALRRLGIQKREIAGIQPAGAQAGQQAGLIRQLVEINILYRHIADPGEDQHQPGGQDSESQNNPGFEG